MRLKIALLAGSREMIRSRTIEARCRRDMQFIVVSGDLHPQFTTIAGVIARSAEQLATFFTQVLLVCSLHGDRVLSKNSNDACGRLLAWDRCRHCCRFYWPLCRAGSIDVSCSSLSYYRLRTRC